MFSIRKPKFIIIIVIAFLLGGALSFGGLYLFNFVLVDGSRAISADEYRSFKTLQENYSRVEDLRLFLKDNFYREIDDYTITTGLLRGLFGAPNDPFTMYYTKEELNPVISKTTGEMSGVGVTLVATDNNEIEVTNVIRDSAAEAAGVMVGDLIVSVNGKTFDGTQLNEAVAEAQGEAGTEVKVTVLRDGKEIDFEITRANFIVPSTTTELLEGNIGYIKISTFNQGTADDFERAIAEMEEKGLNGVVIDVRDNNGGIVEQAMRMLDLIIDESVVAYTEDGHGNREAFETTNGKTSLPFVVLVNKQSASAAEIFALGVKNTDAGSLIGETTFGKGVIQKILTFDEGDGARITVMQYLAPDGTPVDGIGITPEIKIAPSQNGMTDTILDKGLEVLKNR